MKGATALKKIRARAKQLKKKSPGAKYTNLMKKAGAEYRAGKLSRKKRKKATPKKAAKRRARRKRVGATVAKVARVGAVHKRRSYRRKKHTVKRRRARIGKKSNGIMWLVLGAAALVGVILILNNQRQRVQYVPTGNVSRDNTASNILAYAQAANLSLAAITKLIQQINASNDAQVQNIYDVIKTDPGSFESVAGVGYVQDGFQRPALGY